MYFQKIFNFSRLKRIMNKSVIENIVMYFFIERKVKRFNSCLNLISLCFDRAKHHGTHL